MSGALKLEDFGGHTAPANAPGAATSVSDSVYEDGYRAGWDDAVAAAAQDQTRVTEDLAKSLSDISFGYTEARSHVLNGLAPVLRVMAEKMLPEAARAHFTETVIAAARELAGSVAEAPVELAVAPDARVALERVIPETLPFAVEITEDPNLAPGQALMRGAGIEKALDIEAAENAIRSAVADFITVQTEERHHG